MRGSLLYADGMIYAGTSSGIFHVLQPTSDGVESIYKVRLPRGEEVGGSPIVSHGVSTCRRHEASIVWATVGCPQ